MQYSSFLIGKELNQSTSYSMQQQLQLSRPVEQVQPLAFRNQLPYNNQQQQQWKQPLNSDVSWQKQKLQHQEDDNSKEKTVDIQKSKGIAESQSLISVSNYQQIEKKQELSKSIHEGLANLQQIQQSYNQRHLKLNQSPPDATNQQMIPNNSYMSTPQQKYKTNYPNDPFNPGITQSLPVLEHSGNKGQQRRKYSDQLRFKNNQNSNSFWKNKRASQKQFDVNMRENNSFQAQKHNQLPQQQIQYDVPQEDQDYTREDILKQYKKFKKLKQKINKAHIQKSITTNTQKQIAEGETEEAEKEDNQNEEEFTSQTNFNQLTSNQIDERDEKEKYSLSRRASVILQEKSSRDAGSLKRLVIKLYQQVNRKCEQNRDLKQQILEKNQQIISAKKQKGIVDENEIDQLQKEQQDYLEVDNWSNEEEEFAELAQLSIKQKVEFKQLSPIAQLVRRCSISSMKEINQDKEQEGQQQFERLNLKRVESIQESIAEVEQYMEEQEINNTIQYEFQNNEYDPLQQIQQEQKQEDKAMDLTAINEEQINEVEQFEIENLPPQQNYWVENTTNNEKEDYQQIFNGVEDPEMHYFDENFQKEKEEILEENEVIEYRFQKSKSI